MARKKKTDEEAKEAAPAMIEEKSEKTEKQKEELKAKLAERAKQLAGGIKEEKKIKKAENLLVPVDDYIQYGCYLGTKVITAQMSSYVYKRRADGLAIFNTDLTDKKLRAAISLLTQYDPKDILICCKRKAGWNALEEFSKMTGIKVFTKKYPAGIMTNVKLKGFFEPKIMFVVDPWLDKNPMHDAAHSNIPIISICDTNNITQYVDAIIPCNNKSNKSIGLVFWIIAREYMKARGTEVQQMPPVDEFIGPDVI